MRYGRGNQRQSKKGEHGQKLRPFHEDLRIPDVFLLCDFFFEHGFFVEAPFRTPTVTFPITLYFWKFLMKKILTMGLTMVSLFLCTTLSAQTALRAGFVESADVFFYMDPVGFNKSAFSQAVEANQSPEQKAEAEAQLAKFTELTGLGEDDIKGMVFSMDIDGIDFESQDPAQLEKAQAVLAVELGKEVTLEKLKNAIEVMSAESGAPVTSFEIKEVDGLKVIQLAGTGTPGEVDKAYGTLSPDGKTALIGFNTLALKDGLARLEQGAPAAPTPDMAAARKVLGNRHMRMALVLPPEARAKIQEGVQTAAAQGGMGAMMMPFAGATSLLVGFNAAENLSFSLSLDLGQPGNAEQASGMIQGFLPMIMMGMAENAGPEAMNFMQKIQIKPEGSAVTLSFDVTPEEAAAMGSMAPAAPMMMP